MNKKMCWIGLSIFVIGLAVTAVAGTAGIAIETAFTGSAISAIGWLIIIIGIFGLEFYEWLRQ